MHYYLISVVVLAFPFNSGWWREEPAALEHRQKRSWMGREGCLALSWPLVPPMVWHVVPGRRQVPWPFSVNTLLCLRHWKRLCLWRKREVRCLKPWSRGILGVLRNFGKK